MQKIFILHQLPRNITYSPLIGSFICNPHYTDHFSKTSYSIAYTRPDFTMAKIIKSYIIP